MIRRKLIYRSKSPKKSLNQKQRVHTTQICLSTYQSKSRDGREPKVHYQLSIHCRFVGLQMRLTGQEEVHWSENAFPIQANYIYRKCFEPKNGVLGEIHLNWKRKRKKNIEMINQLFRAYKKYVQVCLRLKQLAPVKLYVVTFGERNIFNVI